MNQLQIFKNEEFGQVRVLEVEGETHFVLKDVCDVLGLSDTRRVAERLDDDECIQTPVTDNLGREQQTYTVNESGLYNVIIRSDKPQARQFKRWITHDVIPSIRKTGSYKMPLTKKEEMRMYLDALEEQEAKIEAVNEDLQAFKRELPILGIECDRITVAVKRRGVESLGGKMSHAYQDRSLRGKVYSDIHGQLRREFDVSSYKAIKRNQSDLAVKIIGSYKTPLALQEQINECNQQISQEF